MTDIADRGEAYQAKLNADALRIRMPEGPKPTGFCFFCHTPVKGQRRWCDAECRDDWEREQPA